MLGLVDELRASGIRTGTLANGTDTIQAEAAEMNLDAPFETVFNSAELGWTKLDVRGFQHVLYAITVGLWARFVSLRSLNGRDG